jgi:short-subunit dehydrogenase
VNVSSQTSVIPANLVATYASTKSFINKFTESMNYEYRNTKLVFQCLNTGLVKTNASVKGVGKMAKASDLDACKYSAAAISTLGYSRHTGGHWTHGLHVFTL